MSSRFLALIRLAVREVDFPVTRVFGSQRRVVDYQQVLRVAFLGLFREIK